MGKPTNNSLAFLVYKDLVFYIFKYVDKCNEYLCLVINPINIEDLGIIKKDQRLADLTF